MDNHPIPQDVTGFQFKLIGNMTVKQFAYLAAGIVFAWVLYQLPINIFIKFPFCAFSAILGIGLAFVPVSGRPMDIMIGNYIKALIRPTQFIYQKVGGQIYLPSKIPLAAVKNLKQYANALSPFPKDKLKTYLESLNTANPQPIDIVEKQSIAVPQPIAVAAPASLNTTQPNIPQPPIFQGQTKITLSAPRTLNRQSDVSSISDSPNLITGITKDARGNALPSILVEVKDKDGSPIRAFRTNEFGRFASATPLTNGTYTIEFEDPKAQNKFEKITINVTGQIIAPITAVSIDTREELRRSLFNTN